MKTENKEIENLQIKIAQLMVENLRLENENQELKKIINKVSEQLQKMIKEK